jgi:beta-mannosidase
MRQRIELGGEWQFGEAGSSRMIDGALPGCNYLDLMNAGEIEDPFWGRNEEAATQLAEKDYLYARSFSIDQTFLQHDRLELVVSGLDTLGIIHLNGVEIGRCSNAHRSYRFVINGQLKAGENEISIIFHSPVVYIRAKNAENPLDTFGMADFAAHIRKPQCHFGWDWGPNLPLVGIHGSIAIEGCSKERVTNLKIEQQHADGQVELLVSTEIERLREYNGPLYLRYRLEAPDGRVQTDTIQMERDQNSLAIQVENPKLWWCNGLGEQPLYTFTIELLEEKDNLSAVDSCTRQIGLRTIRLDTSADKWGRNFRFLVNGVPIFAKGADWIPSDSFVTRTIREDLDFYIKSAKDANMNMLRVWGGGYYESDTFYDLCDQYGILVWQDFAFACAAYPLGDTDFLDNVKQEVIDNVRRLRHRASLALWCGNNEIKIMGMMFKKKETCASHDEFFYNTLKGWVAAEDRQTPYWQSSPSSCEPQTKGNDLTEGDTHLWQVWHGMQPLESFRKYPTRFCSEFGVESMPSMAAIRSFTDQENPTLFDPVMQAHQKSVGGNEKMLFYILSKYRNPATLQNLIYLSQLIQSETVRMATEFWRRNSGRCNGAIYWQYNDCWPVASWAGIDYQKQFKAVQYRAKHFNQMLCVSAEMHPNRAEIYIINDHPGLFTGCLRWRLVDFAGNNINSKTIQVSVEKNTSTRVEVVKFAKALAGRKKGEAALILELLDITGNIVSTQNNLLVADKEASLKKPNLKPVFSQKGGMVTLNLAADSYSRFTFVEIDGVSTPLSDNFFDIEAGQTVELTFAMPSNKRIEDLEKGLHITTLTDVKPKGSLLDDKLIRLKTSLSRHNIAMWFVFKFLM